MEIQDPGSVTDTAYFVIELGGSPEDTIKMTFNSDYPSQDNTYKYSYYYKGERLTPLRQFPHDGHESQKDIIRIDKLKRSYYYFSF